MVSNIRTIWLKIALILLTALSQILFSFSLVSNNTQKWINVLNEKAWLFTRNNIDSTIHYGLEALRLADSINYVEGQVGALTNLGFGFYIKNNSEKSRLYSERAFSLSKQFNLVEGQVRSLNNLGLLKWRKGSYIEALAKYREAVDLALLSNVEYELSRSYNYMGLVYWKVGDYAKSVEFLFKALEIKEKLGDDFETALTLNNLSNVYNEMGKYDDAITFANRALKISRGSENYTIGRALGNIGVSYLKMGNYDEALESLKEALNVKKRSGEVKGLGYTNIDIGDIYVKIDSLALAFDHYREALRIMSLINDSHGLAVTHNKLGKVYYMQNKLKLSRKEINNSMFYAKKENLTESIKNNYLLLSEVAENANDARSSLKYFKLYTSVKDSLLNANNNLKIADLQVRYQTVKKENENEILRQKNIIQAFQIAKQNQYIIYMSAAIIIGLLILSAILYRSYLVKKTSNLLTEKNKEIEKQRKRLEELNNTKDKLFSIIAHDLKNPFQNILGNSNLLAASYGELTENEKQDIIKQIENSSKASYQLLENLLRWAQAQTGNLLYLPTKLMLKDIVSDTIKPLKSLAAAKDIKIINRVADVGISCDEDFLKTILRNLVTNSVKYTGKNGKVEITYQVEKNEKIIGVIDNGVGIEKHRLNSLFEIERYESKPGTFNEKGTGLGLIICNEFVQRYNGRIWAESVLGEGSKFYFTLPSD